jgi:hypothetical protein
LPVLGFHQEELSESFEEAVSVLGRYHDHFPFSLMIFSACSANAKALRVL